MDDTPEPIQVAVDRLSSLPGVTVESSPEFVSAELSWAIQLRLTSAQSSDFVPEETRWVALVDGTYPAGRVRVFPAQNGGLVHTFPHQDRNVVPKHSRTTWRTGKPCLDSSSQHLGRTAGGPEPKNDAEERLQWHLERCLAWLEAAATKRLMVDDEPFEVPQCPSELLNTRFTIVHDEGEDTLSAWGGHVRQFGTIHWDTLPEFKNTIVAQEFLDTRGDRIRLCRRAPSRPEEAWVGYWWLWPEPIVIPPWHAPGTWADLRRTGNRLEVDVDAFTRWLAQRAATEKTVTEKTVIVLLGYRIPALWHGPSKEVHWQAIMAPKIPKTIKPLNGFRPNERGRNERLRRDIFSGSKRLSYVKTANWHPDRLQARGRFPMSLRERSVAIVGAGALGSAVAELLGRGGVGTLLIIDHDKLEAGNLVRHTLTGKHLGHNKAVGVAARLQETAPMSRITSLENRLPQGNELQTLLEPFDVVVDCTGDDDPLHRLGAGWWSVPRLFLSASLGFAALRLFLFEARACCFPYDDFHDAVRPWLEQERAQWTNAGETLEGAGCWSPLFPARSDDVWLAAVTVVKHLERSMSCGTRYGLHVLEQRSNDVVGFQPIAAEEGA